MKRQPRIELYCDSDGKWRWRYVSNGRVMADSGQGYWRKRDAIHGIELVFNGSVDVHGTGQPPGWVEFNQSHVIEGPIEVRVHP